LYWKIAGNFPTSIWTLGSVRKAFRLPDSFPAVGY
jgi:hypothetical protein